MPLASEMLNSKFLKRDDVSFDADILLTVAGCVQEEMPAQDNKTPEKKWVLYFEEQKKGLVLNNTNIKTMQSAYGDDTDGWIGKRVILWNDRSANFRGIHGSLKLRPMKPQRVEKSAETTESADKAKAPFNDPIPY